MSRALLAFSLVALVGTISSALNFSSPCPGLFHYDSADEPNQWTGTVTLLSDVELHGVWLRLIFDEKLTELDVLNNFGELVFSDDRREVLVKNRDYLLKSGTPTHIKIAVKYESDKIPTLIGYRLNAQMVCSTPEDSKFGPFFPGDLHNVDFLSSITPLQTPPHKEFAACGTAPLSVDKKAQNGQWPWQASIYIQNNDLEKYICQATLISSRHLLTSAHCLSYQKSELAVASRRFHVYLGRSNPENKEQVQEKFGVEKVVLHPGYRAKGLLNDLAIIQLDKAVIIGDYVRPICLKQETAEKEEGFLVGYGIREDKVGDLGQARVKVVGEEECGEKNAGLKGLLSDNVLCATYVQGESSCVGDSGSSFASIRAGPKPVWELKGVVTVGVVLQDKYACDQSSRVLLINVANYLKWIQEVVAQE